MVSRRSGSRGQVIVIVVFAMVGLMAAAGLAFDIGRFYSERRYLQNAADAGALAVTLLQLVRSMKPCADVHEDPHRYAPGHLRPVLERLAFDLRERTLRPKAGTS